MGQSDAMTLRKKLEQLYYRKATEVSDDFYRSLIDVALAVSRADAYGYDRDDAVIDEALSRLDKALSLRNEATHDL